jgi:beta-glucosidase/6-phospho-beta-glucosidase/beta-galactosidase
MDQNHTKSPFTSIFWAGFECAYALKKTGRMDLLAETKHDIYCREDYRLLKDIGITTVREGLAWHQIDNNGMYDFSRFEEIMAIGVEEGIQQIWDLNHFDYPDYLDPMSEQFIEQFALYAQAAVKIIRKYQDGQLVIVPINEISYFAWVGAEVGRWAPFLKDCGWEFKQQLVRASVAAMHAIRTVDQEVEFIQVDPLMRRIPNKRPSKEVLTNVDEFNRNKLQTWDMLAGFLAPELGGAIKTMGYLGINYYYFNQEWVLNKKDKHGEFVNWGIGWDTPNRVSLAVLLKEVYDRYHLPIVISETGGWGEYRWKWWQRVIKEVKEAQRMGIPVYGICAYPAVDRPDWEKGHLTNSGLWDFEGGDEKCRRVPHTKTIQIIKKYISTAQAEKTSNEESSHLSM